MRCRQARENGLAEVEPNGNKVRSCRSETALALEIEWKKF
jgi:hypothetical protein